MLLAVFATRDGSERLAPVTTTLATELTPNAKASASSWPIATRSATVPMGKPEYIANKVRYTSVSYLTVHFVYGCRIKWKISFKIVDA